MLEEGPTTKKTLPDVADQTVQSPADLVRKYDLQLQCARTKNGSDGSATDAGGALSGALQTYCLKSSSLAFVSGPGPAGPD